MGFEVCLTVLVGRYWRGKEQPGDGKRWMGGGQGRVRWERTVKTEALDDDLFVAFGFGAAVC